MSGTGGNQLPRTVSGPVVQAASVRDVHVHASKCSSNTQPHETRWPALQKAGIDDLFSVVLLSYPLGVRILRTNDGGDKAGAMS
jgi:hypothetical protein